MKKKLVIGGVIILVVAIAVFVGAAVLALKDIGERNILINEINGIKASKSDTSGIDTSNPTSNGEANTTGEYSFMEIKSKGEYGLVEKQVKEDCKLYFDTIDKLNENYTKGAQMKVVNIENYKNDGPEFNNSITELNNIKTGNAECIATLDSIVDAGKIEERAKNAGITGKYLDLYKEILVEIQLSEGIATAKTKDAKFNAYIDSLINLLTYMKENSNEWFIENDTLKSKSEIFINEYNKLLNETNIEL